MRVTLTTANLRRALSVMPALRFTTGLPAAWRALRPRLPTIHVDDRVRYQRIIGFGAAMTDSSAWLMYDELSPSAREGLMQALFGSSGIHLTFVRIPIGASDFSATGTPYTYDDLPAGGLDPLLDGFSIVHDDAYVIPALQAMLTVDPGTYTMASPWTAPPWMKANDAFDNGVGAGVLLAADYQPFAAYLVKFIQSYEAAGIPIDALTPQNEPEGPSPFPGMQLDEPAEAELIVQYLEPSLLAAGLRTQIYGVDSGGLLDYARALLSSPAGAVLSGVAWHCYGGLQFMTSLHREFPAVDQLVSECSPGIIPHAPIEVAIDAARNWAGAVALWNLALDPSGGPVQPPNWGCRGCTGVVTISEQTRSVSYRLNYFQFGLISKYVAPGAVRIASTRLVSDFRTDSGSYGVTPGLDDAAFIDPDGTRVLVVYNNSRSTRDFAIGWRRMCVRYKLGARAAATFRWR
ncbi:MAG: glycoside hydrolase family 30 protein [Solirubrobacteraceae bacterium]